MTDEIRQAIDNCPIRPTNGRVCVLPLAYKPSKTIEVLSVDNADITEGYVASLGKCKYGRKKKGKGWEITNQEIPHDVNVGDRVIFKPQYIDEDFITMNSQQFRVLDPWDIMCVVEHDRPDGFTNAITGEFTPDTQAGRVLWQK